MNGHYDNIDFKCADVTSPDLDIASGSADLVFSNWLLMYLSDEEVAALVTHVMKWLRPGGHVFFRESCFHQSGDHKRKNNPTHYRQPSAYTKVRFCFFVEARSHLLALPIFRQDLFCKLISLAVRNINDNASWSNCRPSRRYMLKKMAPSSSLSWWDLSVLAPTCATRKIKTR